jgi:anti-sigma factor RsiW
VIEVTCKSVQDLILTDYLDGQLGEKQKLKLEEHLGQCRHCQEFVAAARKITIDPFANTKKIDPPAYLWSRIRDSILAEQEEKACVLAGFWQRLESVFHIPVPVLARSTIIVFILVIGTMAQVTVSHRKAAKAQEQMEYYAYLASDADDVSMNGSKGLGTLIEKYFL